MLAFALPCVPAPARAAKKLAVVATVGDLGAIAREVLGDAGEVTVLARPSQDPHFVDARPSLILALNRADALVSMGLGYEGGWLPVLVRGARNPAVQPGRPGYVVAATLVELRDIPRQPIDRSMGDVHPGGNPHFTLDPHNAARIARGLAVALTALAPELGTVLAGNATGFAARLAARTRAWEARLAPLRGAGVVTYHRSFVYLFAWLGLVEVATIEPKPGIPPSAAHVVQVIGAMRARQVRAVLQERWYPSHVAERIAAETGARLALVPGMTGERQSYGDHLDEVVGALAAALGGAGDAGGAGGAGGAGAGGGRGR